MPSDEAFEDSPSPAIGLDATGLDTTDELNADESSDHDSDVPGEIDAAEIDTAETGDSVQLEEYVDVNDDEAEEEIQAAQQAFAENDSQTESVDFEDDEQAVAAAEPFVGQWNGLVSQTNWEKGRIICQWREELDELGASPIQYSDQAWVRRVGGVTAPHVGRLRRVFDRFSKTQESYAGLYWSHFLAALDWDDAPLWLEGAVNEKWSVSQMRNKRWESLGAVASQRPTSSQIIDVDLDEDVVLPAQGGGTEKEYDGDGSGAAAGPKYNDPDFGDSDELVSLAGSETADSPIGIAAEGMTDGGPAIARPLQRSARFARRFVRRHRDIETRRAASQDRRMGNRGCRNDRSLSQSRRPTAGIAAA